MRCFNDIPFNFSSEWCLSENVSKTMREHGCMDFMKNFDCSSLINLSIQFVLCASACFRIVYVWIWTYTHIKVCSSTNSWCGRKGCKRRFSYFTSSLPEIWDTPESMMYSWKLPNCSDHLFYRKKNAKLRELGHGSIEIKRDLLVLFFSRPPTCYSYRVKSFLK